MNRNAAIVLAVVIGALVLGTVVVVIPLLNATRTNTLVEFYDEDGNLVDVPMAITAGGQEVTTMTVTVTWTIEGENIQADTFAIDGVIVIGLVDQDTLRVFALDTFRFDSTDMVGSKSHTWVLADLLPMSDQDVGWILEIKAVLGASGTDTEGNPVSDDMTTSPISAVLAWDSQTGALNIIDCAVTRAYP